MNKEKIKLIVRNLELLVQSLKEELDLEDRPQYNYEEITTHLSDYDEVFYDDEDE
jgi:hypothetical protein